MSVRELNPSELAAGTNDAMPHDFWLQQRDRLWDLLPEASMQMAFLETISLRALDVLYGSHPFAAPSLKSITWVVTNSESHSVAVRSVSLISSTTVDIYMSLPALTELHPRGPLTRSTLESVMLPLVASAWQHRGNAPQPLLDGIADVARIVSGHAGRAWPVVRAPLHASWDSPLSSHAIGYFLLWVEDKASRPTPAFTACLNAALRTKQWSMDLVVTLTAGGKSLPELWREFQSYLSVAPIYWGPDRHELARQVAGRRVVLRSLQGARSCLAVESAGPSGSDARLTLADVRERSQPAGADAGTSGGTGALAGAGTGAGVASAAVWLVDVAPDGAPYYILTHARTRMVLDVPEWRTEQGARLGVWEGNGGANQQWEMGVRPYEDVRFEGHAGKDQWKQLWIRSRHSDKVVSAASNGDIVQAEYCAEDSQMWQVEVQPDD